MTLHYAQSRGRNGIHYSGFTDSSSEASSAPHRLACTTHQLSHYYANRVLLLVKAIKTSIQTDCSVLVDELFPAIFARSPTSRSAGPNKAYPAKMTNSMTCGQAATSMSARIPHTR